MKHRSIIYYQKKFPMGILQQAAHDQACKRVIEVYKDHPMKVNKGVIEKLLISWHKWLVNCVENLHKWNGPDDPSVIHIAPFAYIRKIFPALFVQMRDNGEFTEEEWDVIRNEFYKEELDIYERLMKNRLIWNQKQKQSK